MTFNGVMSLLDILVFFFFFFLFFFPLSFLSSALCSDCPSSFCFFLGEADISASFSPPNLECCYYDQNPKHRYEQHWTYNYCVWSMYPPFLEINSLSFITSGHTDMCLHKMSLNSCNDILFFVNYLHCVIFPPPGAPVPVCTCSLLQIWDIIHLEATTKQFWLMLKNMGVLVGQC